MFKNYLKIALRNLRKNKLYSSVNVIGLTIGLVGCLLIGIYVWNELTYDKFHKNGDRIARIIMETKSSGSADKIALTGTKVGPEFKRSFPQVEFYVRTMKYPLSLANGEKAFDEKNVLYADADFFNMFSFPLLRGNVATVLDGPQKIVLTEKAAKRYFANDDPIGKVLRINGGTKEYEVTGIVTDAPLNSQIQYDIIISFASTNAFKTEKWSEANYVTYLLLNNKNQIKELDAVIQPFMKKISKDELRIPETSGYKTFHLEPLESVHLHSNVAAGLEANGNITYIYVLSVVAILILLIACVNYTNLATAQSVSRGTEIGVRKVMGAGKSQLLKQFLGESFVITCIALVLAIVAGIVLLPMFNNITGKEFEVSLFFSPLFLLTAILLCIVISLIAGAYPAFVLSNTRLVNILKSGLRVSSSGGGLRKSLITFQFVIAIFLVAATFIVVKQVSYIQNKKIGYNREQVVVLPVDYKTRGVYDQMKDAIRANANVLSVTGAYEDPTSIGWGDGIVTDDGQGQKELSLNATPVDLDYLKTMGMELAAGRDFQRSDFATQDTSANGANYKGTYIINEKAARDLGWTAEQAIGKTVSRGVPGPVVGVVKDFHFESLHTAIGPLLIFLDTSLVSQMFVKIKAENTASTIAALGNIWKTRVTHRPFDYHFLDEDFNTLYKAEERTAKIFTLFSGLAIILACLGLFALAAFTTIQRTKEIGIRKILGANVTNITVLVAKQFLSLVGIAILIATPLAWWAGNTWIADFAYRTELNWWIFAIAGLLAVIIALATVSYHAIRAAMSNPVKSLRSE
ncbi:ABC transporter permease [Terrimonas rubra]|uniref:ABC transporter permease n=1 Tax=Terrimonas rubra TaxID=1035890 RepID=A0ABW6A717_9BACT